MHRETFMVAVDKKQVKLPAFSMGWQQTKQFFVMNFFTDGTLPGRKERYAPWKDVLPEYRHQGLPVKS